MVCSYFWSGTAGYQVWRAICDAGGGTTQPARIGTGRALRRGSEGPGDTEAILEPISSGHADCPHHIQEDRPPGRDQAQAPRKDGANYKADQKPDHCQSIFWFMRSAQSPATLHQLEFGWISIDWFVHAVVRRVGSLVGLVVAYGTLSPSLVESPSEDDDPHQQHHATREQEPVDVGPELAQGGAEREALPR
jgi:hypothetical protein